MDDAVWDATVFTKNRERLLAGDVARAFLEHVVAAARAQHLLSSEHFSVDGTLIEAWASLKSFQRKDDVAAPPPEDPGNPTVDFHGERRRNATHASTTDPEARLFRKGKGHESKLCHQAHVLMENRHGLAVDGTITPPAGTAERETAVTMLGRVPKAGRLTLGADKGYDTREFVEVLREMAVTPHVTQNTTNRASAIDDRTTRHPGYALSQRMRMRIEEIFGVAQDGRAAAEDPAPRHRTRRVDVRLRLGGLQPRSHPKPRGAARVSMKRPLGSPASGPARAMSRRGRARLYSS